MPAGWSSPTSRSGARARCRRRRRPASTAHVRPLLDSGMVPVLGGFIGATRQGATTTLGRGGSDWSASLLGAALGADEIQIWTDVDGMMTVDPRVVAAAQALPSVTFDEAAELAYFGAKVLHPETIRPAIERGIPVRILNSLRPQAPGTLIRQSADGMPRRAARHRLQEGHLGHPHRPAAHADGLRVRGPRVRGVRPPPHAGGPHRDLRGLDLADRGRPVAAARGGSGAGHPGRREGPPRHGHRQRDRPRLRAPSRASRAGSSTPSGT